MTTCCTPTIITPGTPTSCTGYALKLTANAIRCDQTRLLARLQTSSSQCCPPNRPNGSAVYASIKEQEAATRCSRYISGSGTTDGISNGNGNINSSGSSANTTATLSLPKSGVPESVRIQNIIQQTILASTDQFNPETRFSAYDRVFPPIPCITPESKINPAIPKPSDFGQICHIWPGS